MRLQIWGRIILVYCLVILPILCYAGMTPQLVSVRNASQGASSSGAGDSGASLVTPDGRYVVFASSANNLIPRGSPTASSGLTPPRLNIFVRDRTTGSTVLVSASVDGSGEGNGDSWPTGISSNGQYVLFESAASNLVPGDNNNAADVFLRDIVHGTTALVSVGLSGNSGNGASRSSVMTPDGQRVAFVSLASDLVAGDTNQIADVFVRDMTEETTILVSAGASPSSWSPGVSGSETPCITPDGRYIAFCSTATNLVPGAVTQREIYVRDLVAQTTTWASTNAAAMFWSLFGSSNVASFNHAISADGRFVAYEAGPNAGYPASGAGLIIRQNLQTGATDRVSSNAAQPVVYENSRSLDMTSDGRYIAYVGNAGSSAGPARMVYQWDALSTSNTPVSVDIFGATPSGDCHSPAQSTDGQLVSFVSNAGNLTTNSASGGYHAYVRNMGTGTTALIDVDTNGMAAGVDPTMIPALSSGGQYAAFTSASGSLVTNDFNHGLDVFARDFAMQQTELISARDASLPSLTPDGTSVIFTSGVSTNGRFIAFASDADDLVSNDTNQYRDVFVRDLITGTNMLASVGINGASANGMSVEPGISGDGRYAVFTSFATNLVIGDTNNARDVFVRDLVAGTNELVSAGATGGLGNGDSYSPTISPDGRYVLFRSLAQNLAVGSFSGENLFLRDRQMQSTLALTTSGVASSAMTPDGRAIAFSSLSPPFLYVWDTSLGKRIYTNTSIGTSVSTAISPDARRIAYTTTSPVGLRARDLVMETDYVICTGQMSSAVPKFSGDGRFLVYSTLAALDTRDTNGVYDVYLYDFQSATNLLVCRGFDSGMSVKGGSGFPDISVDGRFVVYQSAASNCVPNDPNQVSDVFLYDRSNAAITVVSASALGNFTANRFSRQPVFIGNGMTLFFQSWATDLANFDFGGFGKIYALNLADVQAWGTPTNIGSIYLASYTSNGGSSPLPMLSWPAVFGTAYHVQFKNSLSDPAWQDLAGNTTVQGASAYTLDLAPAVSQRFYRVIINP